MARLSFDGTPHLRECDKTYGCDCAARMSRIWYEASQRAAAREKQAPVADDAVPAPIDPERTERIARETDAELLERHDAGETAPITYPWPVAR